MHPTPTYIRTTTAGPPTPQHLLCHCLISSMAIRSWTASGALCHCHCLWQEAAWCICAAAHGRLSNGVAHWCRCSRQDACLIAPLPLQVPRCCMACRAGATTRTRNSTTHHAASCHEWWHQHDESCSVWP